MAPSATEKTSKSPYEPEIAQKTGLSEQEQYAQQQAKDIAYTINHAFACTAVDLFGQTPAMMAIQKAFGVRNPSHIGCSNPFHKHEHGKGCNHHHHASEAALHAKHVATLGALYSTTEVIGDFGGVIPTVLMQRYTPWAMDGVRPVLRATLGPVFHWGAKRSTNQWAQENGIATNSEEYKEHLDDIYEHEMHHLPQAAWWTVWSSALNIGLQQPCYEYMATPQIRHEFPLGSLRQRIMTKIGGASLSIGLVLGTRALFPETAHRFTDWTETNLVTPATKVVARSIGLDEQAVKDAIADKKRYHDGNWQETLDQPAPDIALSA